MKPQQKSQFGLTYIEVLVAAMLIAVALVPAVEALHTGILGANVFDSTSNEHYAVLAKMEEVLAEPRSALTSAAALAGSESTPSSYSDAASVSDRRLVYIALYDADNADGDNDVFTVLDPNLDGDNDPYTGYDDILWVRVEVTGSIINFESLVAP